MHKDNNGVYKQSACDCLFEVSVVSATHSHVYIFTLETSPSLHLVVPYSAKLHCMLKSQCMYICNNHKRIW